MKKSIVIIIAVLVVAIAGVVWLNVGMPLNKKPVVVKTPPPVIGFSLGTTREERWATDQSLFTKRVSELGGVVSAVGTDYDVTTQISQIENLISQGIKVIVVVAADSDKLAPVIAEANAAGVKIIAYDRMIKNCNLDFYVSFDNVKVGELEAQGVLNVVDKGNFAYVGGGPTDNNALLVQKGSMNILNPLIQKGDIKLVFNKFSDNWDPDVAYKNLKAYLDTGKTVDAIVAANDGTAGGAIQTLREKHLDGKVPVSGQDAELAACQRIVAGTQTATVYKPFVLEANESAEVAMAMAKGETPQTNSTVNNGQIDVPSFLLTPVLVTKDNMQSTIVKDGFHSYDAIYNKTTATK
jgi:D-xylose transport system substrate-binding protein